MSTQKQTRINHITGEEKEEALREILAGSLLDGDVIKQSEYDKKLLMQEIGSNASVDELFRLAKRRGLLPRFSNAWADKANEIVGRAMLNHTMTTVQSSSASAVMKNNMLTYARMRAWYADFKAKIGGDIYMDQMFEQSVEYLVELPAKSLSNLDDLMADLLEDILS